jgi:hypothetical protein
MLGNNQPASASKCGKKNWDKYWEMGEGGSRRAEGEAD